jgi:hypothetical protein
VHKNQISSNYELKSLHYCKKNSLEKPLLKLQPKQQPRKTKTAAKKNQNSSRRQY